MKKSITVFLCLMFAVSCLFGCVKNPDVSETTDVTDVAEETSTPSDVPENKVTLGYYEDKPLNPFTTDSPTNRRLMTLVYDSLFIISDSYTPEPLIAESYFSEGTDLTVIIASELVFSDLSPITPSDVVYSFNLAKNSSNYSGLLTNFLSAHAQNDSVSFTLDKENIGACSCLIFPIVKFGTGEQNIPVGSGRYSLLSQQDRYLLSANENTTRNEEMSLKEIDLTPITSDNKELYLLQTGDLSYFFDDLSDGEFLKIGANTAVVSLNNMVYLGCNSNKALFSDPRLTTAISYCIDRSGIIQSCYGGMGTATDIPFNPKWQSVTDIKIASPESDLTLADELLKSCGYVYAYSDNKYRSKNFEFLKMTMIVNTENTAKLECARMLRDSLEDIGIDITLSELSYDDYQKALYRGEYDLYVGEVKLSPDMDLSCFFAQGGSLGYGINSEGTAAEAYYDFIAGKIDITTFIQVYELERPFIPLLFREAVAYYSRELTYEDTISEYEPFENIYSWGFAGL